MTNRICEQCGNELPAGARFCAQCGTAVPVVSRCPHCNSETPAAGKFCIACGHPLAAAPASPVVPAAPAPEQPRTDSQGWDFNREEEEAEAEKARRAAEAEAQARLQAAQAEAQARQQAAQAQQAGYSSAYYDEPEKKRRNNGPLIAAIITALILAVAGFFFFNGRSNAQASDVDTIEVPISTDEAAEILRATLNKENRLGDLASVAFAIEVNANKAGEKQIAGVTYYSSLSNRSFYKVYTITRDSLTENWRITYELNRTVDKYLLNFKADEVVGEGNEMPQHVTTIGDKDYMFFAFGALPQTGSQQGKVVMCLYEAQTSDFITVAYEGDMVERDGRKLVYGKAENVRRSAETEFLVAQAETAALIYHPTEEELELEKAENANRRWWRDNADNVVKLIAGEGDVKLTVTVYDKPIFSIGDTEDGSRIENDNLIVVADDKGAVYGFSKTKRRYFVVYAPKQESGRSSVQFTADGALAVKASAVSFVLDPRTCLASPLSE